MEDDSANLIHPTAAIIAAFVGNNSIGPAEIPALIGAVHAALRGAAAPAAPAVDLTVLPTPAQIRKSITPDALISFEDGRPYKMLKRHLATLGMTPASYRAKWGLPADYPATAPNYSELRSRMAKSYGLGQAGGGLATAGKGKAKPKAKS